MFRRTQGDRDMGLFFYNSSKRVICKRIIKLIVKTPSVPVSIGVGILETTIKRTTGSEQLARRVALIGHITICVPLGPLAVVGGVVRWKLDHMVDEL